MRAMVLNGTKMACYDQIKYAIVKSGVIPAGKIVYMHIMYTFSW
jgi:hypothetical protein